MMRPMHLLQMSQRHMRINLRSSNIRMPQQSLHTPQIRTMFHHMSRTTMPQLMRTSLSPAHRRSRPHHLPNPLPSQRIPPHTQKQRPRHSPRPRQSPRPHQPRPPNLDIPLQRLNRPHSQRHNPLLIALPSHLHPSLIQMQILLPQRTNLSHPQPTRIQQLQNRVVPQRQPIRIRRPSSRARPLQHLRNFALSQTLRQHLPARRRLHIHRRIMLNPLIQQQPPKEPSQRTHLPSNRPPLHPIRPQPFHKPAHIRLRSPHQQSIPPFNMLRKLLQIAPVSLHRSRTHTLLHPQIRTKLPHHPNIPQSLARRLHRDDYRRPNPEIPPTRTPRISLAIRKIGNHIP